MTIRNETGPYSRFFDDAGTAALSLRDRMRLALRRRAVRRQIVSELEPLRDRELADLGISRADIASIAAEHAAMTVHPATLARR